MPAKTPEIDFRAVSPGDLDLLGQWMETSHWRKWWGDPEEELGFIRDMVEGRDTTRPFIFEVDGRPVGYIQYWFIGEHQNEQWAKDDPWLMELPADAIGVDLSIGAVENLSKGIGTASLRKFVQKLLQDGFKTIIIDPDPDNERAVRAYRKSGFRPVKHLEGRFEGVLVMQYKTNKNELN